MAAMNERSSAAIVRSVNPPLSVSLRFIGGIILVITVTLAIFVLAMRPAVADFRAMTLFLCATALVSLTVGYALFRSGIAWRSPSLRWTLLATYGVSSLLTFVNVWVTARLMFINDHDLTLATILLVFAAGIGMALGYFLFSFLTANLSALNAGALRVAAGQFDTRVHIAGRDEVAQLAVAFNQMAAQLQEAALQQQRLDALRRELIAWVGHDLRTPLASVRAVVEALADGVVEDPDTFQRYLRTAKREVGALSSLIDDLFDMAQIDAGGLRLDLRPNSLSDLISDTLESFTELAAGREVTLNGHVDPGVDPVILDARHIGRVLANLVTNAVRHTPAGGAVTIEAHALPDAAAVDIIDTGEGIQPEDLPYVFDRFYRAEKSRSRATGGAGLGLAIAKGIVETHGGRITVRSTPGSGTTFTFTLPKKPPRRPTRYFMPPTRP